MGLSKRKIDALKRGEDEMLDILSKIKNGNRIFGMNQKYFTKNLLL